MTVSVIPAREGSKRVLNKNLKELNGHPLISYSIEVSLQTKLINETYVSTDSKEIASISKEYGAKIPFIRPKKYAQDNSADDEWINHFLCWYYCEYDYYPDYLVILRPTTPLRNPKIIDFAIEQFRKEVEFKLTKVYTSLRSIEELPESPYKMYKYDCLNVITLEGKEETITSPNLVSFMNIPIENTNLPNQTFPKCFKANGYIDIVDPQLIKMGGLFGNKIYGFITENTVEIDTEDDFRYAFYLINH